MLVSWEAGGDVTSARRMRARQLEAIVAEDFVCRHLRPEAHEPVRLVWCQQRHRQVHGVIARRETPEVEPQAVIVSRDVEPGGNHNVELVHDQDACAEAIVELRDAPRERMMPAGDSLYCLFEAQRETLHVTGLSMVWSSLTVVMAAPLFPECSQ